MYAKVQLPILCTIVVGCPTRTIFHLAISSLFLSRKTHFEHVRCMSWCRLDIQCSFRDKGGGSRRVDLNSPLRYERPPDRSLTSVNSYHFLLWQQSQGIIKHVLRNLEQRTVVKTTGTIYRSQSLTRNLGEIEKKAEWWMHTSSKSHYI